MSKQLLICTDLDRTLIPNGPEPESPHAREHLGKLVAHEGVCLAFVSGRHRKLVEQAITEYSLPVPDFVIGDVGTTIYRVGRKHLWQADQTWEETIIQDWGGLQHADLAKLLADLPALRLQEQEKQNRCKLSYYLPLGGDTDELAADIESRLQAAGVRARSIFSIDEPARTGLLDILPLGASKFHAVTALIDKQGFDLEHTVFCGDSGNDLEVLISPVPAVLVGNASQDIRSQALDEAKREGMENGLYIARGDWQGMNGNYAAGMLEGIAHYHPETLAWMQPAASPKIP